MLRLPHHWIWDSWIADDGRTYHLFFLKAPRALQDPGRRHTASSIGHATSPDLVDWTVHDDALTPAENRWDDLSLWTGSVARGDDGVWRLYYTALNSGGRGVLDQRLGLAESDDLMTWRRVGDAPLLAVDPTWYKTLDGDDTASETWRDPLVVRDPAGDGWQTPPGLHVSPRRADAAATARQRAVLHLVGARRLGARAVGRRASGAVPRGARPLRRAPGAGSRRRLGVRRLPQPRAGGDPLVRDHRSGAGTSPGRRAGPARAGLRPDPAPAPGPGRCGCSDLSTPGSRSGRRRRPR